MLGLSVLNYFRFSISDENRAISLFIEVLVTRSLGYLQDSRTFERPEIVSIIKNVCALETKRALSEAFCSTNRPTHGSWKWLTNTKKTL